MVGTCGAVVGASAGAKHGGRCVVHPLCEGGRQGMLQGLTQIVKYGVVSVDRMCKDLLQWDSLYLSGRMQKPVATLFDSTEGRVPLAEQANLASALRVSFLLLPERFSERELYTKMASLSYMGDFRMRVPGGENKNKIRNIVENQHTWFRFMCADLITRFRFVTVESNPDKEWLQFKVRSLH